MARGMWVTLRALLANFLSVQALKRIAHVKKHGIIQFLNLYRRFKERYGDRFRWGDEVESMLIVVDSEKKEVKLALRAFDLLEVLNQRVKKLRCAFQLCYFITGNF